MNFEHQTLVTKHPFALLSPEEIDLVTSDQIAIRELLGVGATGVVYKAQQIRLGRTVAVKVLSRVERSSLCDLRERFMLEARTMARLNHPNIVRIHDIGETKTGLPYLVMEYVEGINLAALIRGGQLTLEHVASWVPQACEALEYAHNHELVHRDIKPANLMIDLEGRVKITDFGLVKVMRHPDRICLAQAQVLAGTRSYLAPEMLEPGALVDHRADVYSMGAVLYEMLTGAAPGSDGLLPTQVRAELNPRWDAIVGRAMQNSPEHRYSRIADMGREVLAAANESSPGVGRRLLLAVGGRPKRLRFAEEKPAEVRGSLDGRMPG